MLKANHRPINTFEAINRFKAAMAQRGLVPGPDDIIPDGQFHRCNVASKGRSGERDGSYVLHLRPIACGSFNNWCDGRGFQKWRDKVDRKLTPAEVQQIEAAGGTSRGRGRTQESARFSAQEGKGYVAAGKACTRQLPLLCAQRGEATRAAHVAVQERQQGPPRPDA